MNTEAVRAPAICRGPIAVGLMLTAMFATGLVDPVIVRAQEDVSSASERSRLLDAAREIMTAARFCALITQDEDGRSHVRTMDPFPPDDDMVVWLATNPSSRKVSQIRNDGRVTLHYFDDAAAAYVAIYGAARLVDDPAQKSLRWKEGWEVFYPDRENSYLLIEVVPEWLEVVSGKHGIAGAAETWRAPVVRFRDLRR